MNKEKITFIIPTRNNKRFFELSYNSIRKYYPTIEICVADDSSSDGTAEFLINLSKIDNNLKYIISTEKIFLGHTILYDKLINEVCTNNLFIIWHADMICSKNFVENLLKHLKPKTVVSATRIEPPLHPEEPLVKIIKDFGLYHDEFKSEEFESFVNEEIIKNKDKTTEGIFAPWMMYKEDFQIIGGHDDLFKPYPYEDSDIFQRFILAGYQTIQSWDAFCYHFTCRGNRWTEKIGVNHSQYALFEERARRNFIRKWGTWINNNEFGKPIVQHKYDIGFIFPEYEMNASGLFFYEPWCSDIYIEPSEEVTAKEDYIKTEQSKTSFDLSKKIHYINEKEPDNDIVIDFKNTIKNTSGHIGWLLLNIPRLITSANETGIFESNGVIVQINKIRPIEKELISCIRK